MSRTVLVTGASQGIGRAIATAFAKQGDRVVLHYHTSKKEVLELEQTLLDSGAEVFCVCADITKKAEVEQMFTSIHQTFGEVEVLINNAGMAQQKLFTDLTEEEWDNMFDTNIKSAFLCAQLAARQMIRAHRGSIVNISSMWGVSGASCEVHYSASKAAMIGFTKALAKELGPSGITVNCIAPGVIDTRMNAMLSEETVAQLKEETPLCRIGTPKDIAGIAVFLTSEQASFVTGQVITADGGMIL